MDSELEKRLEKLETIIQDDARLFRYERISFRVGAFIFGILTLIVLILAKFHEVLNYASSLRHSISE